MILSKKNGTEIPCVDGKCQSNDFTLIQIGYSSSSVNLFDLVKNCQLAAATECVVGNIGIDKYLNTPKK